MSFNGLFLYLFSKKEKITLKKVDFRGPRVKVSEKRGIGERQIIFPGDLGGEKRPGISGNGFPEFPEASLATINSCLAVTLSKYIPLD